MTQLEEKDLEVVTGGKGLIPQTGDFDDEHRVYIKFPVPFSNFSGFYSCDDVINLCENFYSYKDFITPNITNVERNAITSLFEYHNREIPEKVKEVLGM